jgi:hypothetical protein
MPLFRKDEEPERLRDKYETLQLRRVADKTGAQRWIRWHPITGDRMVVRPETVAHPDFNYERMEPEPWPLLGVKLENEVPPAFTSIATKLVSKGKTEGWISSTGDQVVHKPGGPPEEPWAKTHTFLHSDTITFHFLNGDVTYKVVHQPDKYEDGVDWFYRLERV